VWTLRIVTPLRVLRVADQIDLCRDETAHKSRRWLHQAPISRQLALLPPPHRDSFSLTRYQASALITFRFNRPAIRSLVYGAEDAGRAA